MIVPDAVWAEINLNVAAVTTRRALMTELGLGIRRGVLLAGPPGVGKTAIAQVVANGMLGAFTVITVDARAGQSVLAGVYQEAKSLGPTLVVLEEIIVGHRRAGGNAAALSEFLAVMDIEPSAPILTLASTNDATARDAAAVRTARFDSIIEITYPDRAMATRILETYLHGVPAHKPDPPKIGSLRKRRDGSDDQAPYRVDCDRPDQVRIRSRTRRCHRRSEQRRCRGS